MKYPRTLHIDYNSGLTNDDRIQKDLTFLANPIIITEKLDGHNTSLKKTGVYGRSHGNVCKQPYNKNLWVIWDRINSYLDGIDIFGENLYAKHTIEYNCLTNHFFVIGIKRDNLWLSWDEVKFICELLELTTVPVLDEGIYAFNKIKTFIDKESNKNSTIGNVTKEGFVFRNADEFDYNDFNLNVIKWVNPEFKELFYNTKIVHWKRNWKKQLLKQYNY